MNICSRCQRKLGKPYVQDGALALGRVCAKKMGVQPKKAEAPEAKPPKREPEQGWPQLHLGI